MTPPGELPLICARVPLPRPEGYSGTGAVNGTRPASMAGGSTARSVPPPIVKGRLGPRLTCSPGSPSMSAHLDDDQRRHQDSNR